MGAAEHDPSGAVAQALTDQPSSSVLRGHDERCAINLGLLGASCNCGWTSRFIALSKADSQRFSPEAKYPQPLASDESG